MYACMYVNYHGRELINRIIGLFRRLKRFDYTRCDITVSGLMDSFGCDLIFSQKSPIFPPHSILRPCWRVSPWNLVLAQGNKKTRVMGLPGRTRSLAISSAGESTYIMAILCTHSFTSGYTIYHQDDHKRRRYMQHCTFLRYSNQCLRATRVHCRIDCWLTVHTTRPSSQSKSTDHMLNLVVSTLLPSRADGYGLQMRSRSIDSNWQWNYLYTDGWTSMTDPLTSLLHLAYSYGNISVTCTEEAVENSTH